MAETANWLVVNKPAGLTVVPGPSNREDTLVNRVKGYLVKQGSEHLVPHIITRLDRFTSGLVLIAKHRYANSLFSEQLANNTLHKTYLAFVAGQVTPEHSIIDKPIRKADEGFNQIVASDGRSAQTEYWVLAANDQYSMVKVHLLTGRTHQIRVHFQSEGHPLLGDELYHGPLELGVIRQALHASQLSFTDPFTGAAEAFEAPLPVDLAPLKLNLEK
ncbi:RluA family pseudouridine synthase [Secundilactobacillus oryzae]|uniref:RluA family pseudouridine synthase n=1 Tax=Secundilactobacillus oryzae TaxID=1202668 RepID=UPI000ACD6039